MATIATPHPEAKHPLARLIGRLRHQPPPAMVHSPGDLSPCCSAPLVEWSYNPEYVTACKKCQRFVPRHETRRAA